MAPPTGAATTPKTSPLPRGICVQRRGRASGASLHPVLVTLLALMALAPAACQREYPFERGPAQRGTLGQELFFLWRKDTHRAPGPATERVAMLDARYPDFVGAVDHMVPEASAGALNRFVRQTNPMVDNGTLPGLTRKAALAMEEARGHQTLLSTFLSPYFAPLDSFTSPRQPHSALAHLARWPQLQPMSELLAERMLAMDGLDGRGEPDQLENPATAHAAKALWRAMQPGPQAWRAPTARHWSGFLAEALLSEDPRFATPASASDALPPTALWAVRYDPRGLPRARHTGTALAHPLVDADGDGLADIDAQGRFVLVSGQTARIAPFVFEPAPEEPVARHSDGRAGVPGHFVFDYVDLRQTGLAFALERMTHLWQQDLPWHLVQGGPVLLGTRAVLADEDGEYVGIAPDEKLTASVHAALSILALPELPATLRAVATVVQEAAVANAALIAALRETSEVLERHPEARLHAHQTLLDDLTPILAAIAQDPALWADMMAALRKPIVRRTEEAFLTLLEHRDQRIAPAPGGPYDTCFQQCREAHPIGTEARFDCIRACPNGEVFSSRTEIGGPESPQNRSLMQRLFHLLRDADGVEYALRVEESRIPGVTLPPLPPLAILPGAGEAFVRVIAGKLDLADYLSPEFQSGDLASVIQILNAIPGNQVTNQGIANVFSQLTGIFGTPLDPVPRPDQVTRLFNKYDLRHEDPDGRLMVALTNPRCRDGFVMSRHHADGLYAAEASGLIDVLHPLAVAFSEHNQEGLLTGAIVVLHDHYASRPDLYQAIDGRPSPMKAANLVSYEPAMQEILRKGRIFDALHLLARSLEGVRAEDGILVEEHLRRLVHQASRPGEDFTGPRGEVVTLTLGDGRLLERPSRLQVLTHGLRALGERLDASPREQEHLRAAWRALDQALLQTQDQGEQARFATPATPVLFARVLEALATQAERLERDGELQRWLGGGASGAFEALVASRGFAALWDIGAGVLSSEEDARRWRDLGAWMAQAPGGPEALAMGAYALMVHLMQVDRWWPLLGWAAILLDPDRAWADAGPGERSLPLLTHMALVLKQLAVRDGEGAFFALMARGLEPGRGPQGASSLGTLWDILGEYWRLAPGAGGAWTAEDAAQILWELQRWLTDDVHGLERVYEVMALRHGPGGADWN